MSKEEDKDLQQRYFKKADKTLGKVIIPKSFLSKNGYEFIMDVYDNKIVLTSYKGDKSSNNNEE